MATFNFNVNESDALNLQQISLIETECASQYTYEVSSNPGDSISFELSGKDSSDVSWVSTSYTISGTEYSDWNGVVPKTIVYSSRIYLRFSIENSGTAGVFNEATITVTNSTESLSISDKVTRLNDNQICGAQDGASNYDSLTDTPNVKTGSGGKFVRVKDDESGHEYADVPEGVFNSSLDPSLEMPFSVGSIPAGTTIQDLNDRNLDLTAYVEFQNFPTILASIDDSANFTVSGFNSSLAEIGAVYNPTLTIGYDKGSIHNGDGTEAGPVTGDLLTVNVAKTGNANAYVDNSVSGNSTVATGLSISLTGYDTWTVTGTNSAGTTTYTDNKGGTDTIPSIESAKADTTPPPVNLNKSSVYPFFSGMSATDFSSGGTSLYMGLNKNISTKSNKTVNLNDSGKFIYFAYPASYGNLSSVIDGNGFDVTGSFTKYTANVTSTGLGTDYTESYFIYKTNSVTTVSNQNFKFNF